MYCTMNRYTLACATLSAVLENQSVAKVLWGELWCRRNTPDISSSTDLYRLHYIRRHFDRVSEHDWIIISCNEVPIPMPVRFIDTIVAIEMALLCKTQQSRSDWYKSHSKPRFRFNYKSNCVASLDQVNSYLESYDDQVEFGMSESVYESAIEVF